MSVLSVDNSTSGMTAKISTIEAGTDREAQWELLVASNPHSGFMQSLHWARFKEQQGYKRLHIILWEEDTLVGGGIFYVPPGSKSVGLAAAPEGPVLNWEDGKQVSRAMALVLSELQSASKQLGFMGIHAEPLLAPPVMRAFRNFGRAPYDLVPNETLYLDLSCSEDDLLSQMKPKCRYNIRLAAKHGVEVDVENSEEGLNSFYKLIRDAGERDDFFVEPYDFFAAMFQELAPKGMLKILVARHEGEPLAAMFYMQYGQRATYFYGGISNEKRNVMAGYALQWEAIRMSRQNKLLIYDFFGYTELDDPEHPYQNFSKFKRQFGGKAQKYVGAQQHLFVSRLADAVITAAKELEREGVRI